MNGPSREMTLAEFVGTLPDFHYAAREYAALVSALDERTRAVALAEKQRDDMKRMLDEALNSGDGSYRP